MINYLYYIQKNKIIPINLIKNKHIDYSKNKLKIDIIILIYFYKNKGKRYYFQEFIFYYFIQLKKIFSNFIDFSFTIVGSENDLSRNISNKYFNESEYYEYYQDPKIKTLDMLSEKINYAFRESYKKNTDLLLWFGSNDYVFAHYFTNILEKYNNGLQQYGMTNYLNGNNFCLYIELKQLNFNVDSMYIHDGIHNYCNRQKYKYIGATQGYAKKLLDKFPEILDKINCDEGANEYLVTELIGKYPELNINSMKTNNCFFFNIKFGSDEIHSFDILKKMNNKNIIKLNNFIDNDSINNYKIFFNNLIYIQEHYLININNKINKYNIIIKVYNENLNKIKLFKSIKDELIITKLIKSPKLSDKNISKSYLENELKILNKKFFNLIETLRNLYKKSQIKFKIYNQSQKLIEIKKFIDNYKV